MPGRSRRGIGARLAPGRGNRRAWLHRNRTDDGTSEAPRWPPTAEETIGLPASAGLSASAHTRRSRTAVCTAHGRRGHSSARPDDLTPEHARTRTIPPSPAHTVTAATTHRNSTFVPHPTVPARQHPRAVTGTGTTPDRRRRPPEQPRRRARHMPPRSSNVTPAPHALHGIHRRNSRPTRRAPASRPSAADAPIRHETPRHPEQRHTSTAAQHSPCPDRCFQHSPESSATCRRKPPIPHHAFAWSQAGSRSNSRPGTTHEKAPVSHRSGRPGPSDTVTRAAPRGPRRPRPRTGRRTPPASRQRSPAAAAGGGAARRTASTS